MPDAFPCNLPIVTDLEEMTFNQPVTFFVGENGSGKSTLLESVAAGIGSITIGGHDISQDESLAHARELSRHFRFSWSKRTPRGFFLRSEDFFAYTKVIVNLCEELEEIGTDAALAERAEMIGRYGENLDHNSHGEGFLRIFQERFVPGGLYLLDEPETPLSPLRQLTLLAMLKEMTEEHNAQFIIATHSPIIMAFPDATIYSFDRTPLASIEYDDIEHVTITRDFLNNPERFLRHL